MRRRSRLPVGCTRHDTAKLLLCQLHRRVLLKLLSVSIHRPIGRYMCSASESVTNSWHDRSQTSLRAVTSYSFISRRSNQDVSLTPPPRPTRLDSNALRICLPPDSIQMPRPIRFERLMHLPSARLDSNQFKPPVSPDSIHVPRPSPYNPKLTCTTSPAWTSQIHTLRPDHRHRTSRRARPACSHTRHLVARCAHPPPHSVLFTSSVVSHRKPYPLRPMGPSRVYQQGHTDTVGSGSPPFIR